MAPFLVKLFNLCFEKGTLPDILKIARVIPLHKGGPKSDLTNYRPISLLPQFGKLLENVIKSRLIDFLDEHKIITDNQFGFRKNHSTELAIANIHNTLLQNLDDDKITCSIFLDLAKAFDSVNHNILIRKLEKYGIRGMPLDLLKSYLHNRQHFTKFNNTESNLKVLDIGVPQGSILGPLLFLLFINDLPLVTNFNVKLFADDTFLSLTGTDLKTLQKKVNMELKKVSVWFSNNKLTLNVSKSKFMIIKRSIKKTDRKLVLKFNGKKIEQCSSYKYLGIHLDERLNWKVHVKYLCEKVSKMCGLFVKLRYCCNIELLKVLYYALVESHLQYCNMIWGSARENILEPLVDLQDKIVRIIKFAPYEIEHVESIYNDLKLLDLSQLSKLSKTKFMYKYKNHKLPSCFENFFSSNGSQRYPRRRRNNLDDFKRVSGKTQYGDKMMQYEGVQLWNNTPIYIRNAETVRDFTKKYKSLFFD